MKSVALRLLPALLCFAVPALAGEGYTYQGQYGFSSSFPLIGGQYSLYVNAHNFVNYNNTTGNCIFSASLQRVSPTKDSVQLGGSVPVTGPTPFTLGPKKIDLPAGRYMVYVASQSNCQWTVSLESTHGNSAGVAPVQNLVEGHCGYVASNTVSLKRKIQFEAQYRTPNNTKATVSGELQMSHNGKVFQTFPVSVGNDTSAPGSKVAVNVQWEGSDAKYLGKNSARLVVKVAGQEFSSSTDFTLTP
jgi:hypothetical protein